MDNAVENNEEIIVTLTDENNNAYEASLLTTFQAGLNNQGYAAVLSHVPDENGQLPIQIFRCNIFEQEGDDCIIEFDNIRSDMEFDEAHNVLLTLLDEQAENIEN